jgi:uncharacterized coiled-coil protein SlyX
MCKQEERIIQLERKIEYLERIIMALADYKVSEKRDVVMNDEVIDQRDKFEEEMKKIGTLEQYFGF